MWPMGLLFISCNHKLKVLMEEGSPEMIKNCPCLIIGNDIIKLKKDNNVGSNLKKKRGGGLNRPNIS